MIQNHVPDPDQEVAVDQDHVVEVLQRTHQYVEKTARWRIRGQGLDPNLNLGLDPDLDLDLKKPEQPKKSLKFGHFFHYLFSLLFHSCLLCKKKLPHQGS